MTEEQADKIMEWVEAVEVTRRYITDSGADYTVDYLYELGKLRDDKLDAELISYMYRSRPPLFSYGITDEGKLWENALERLYAM